MFGDIMKKEKKEKKIYDLCFKYNKGCKWCPRYKKCEEEIKKQICKKSHINM